MKKTQLESNLISLSQALEKAQGMFSQKMRDKSLLAAKEITMVDEFVPFFNVSRADERTWLNHQKSWSMDVPDLREGMARGLSFPYVKELNMVLNPHTNKLLKVSSKWPSQIAAIKPMPPAYIEEQQMLQAKERFTGLPDKDMPIDFEDALMVVQRDGPASPNTAKQIVAYHVIHTTVRYSDRPVWIIQTRGITPFLPNLPMGIGNADNVIPVDARNHVRHVVDAETGLWLFSDTTPQPID